MPKGRPLKTEIREKIGAIIGQVNFSYGYEIYKNYKKIFGEIGLRNIYYNLKKGLETGEFIIADIQREPGEFTWGSEAQHLYYGAGPYMLIHKSGEKILAKLSQLEQKDKKINWESELNNLISKLKREIENFRAIESRMRYEDKKKFVSNAKLKIIKLKEWAKSKIEKEKLTRIYSELEEISRSVSQ